MIGLLSYKEKFCVNFDKKWVGLHFGRLKKTHLVTLRPFLTSPLTPGVNLAPRGEICPLGGMFTPRGEHPLLFRGMEGQISQAANFTPGDNIHP
jgi:hypothetical protein